MDADPLADATNLSRGHIRAEVVGGRLVEASELTASLERLRAERLAATGP